jgi:succinate dehydrogenase / fumarate reductase, membrane anchor subunit
MEGVMTERSAERRAVPGNAAGAIWIIQAVSGLLLILLLGLHMIAHHYVVEGGLRTFADVLDYVRNPIIFVLEVLFLLVVTPHAILGLRAIILDLGPSKQAVTVINWVLGIVGVAATAYGIWLAVALQRV